MQLEVEVERGDLLEAGVREMEEKVERVQSEKGGLFSMDALKEMMAEQKGRVSGGAEVESLEWLKVKGKFRAMANLSSFPHSTTSIVATDHPRQQNGYSNDALAHRFQHSSNIWSPAGHQGTTYFFSYKTVVLFSVRYFLVSQ